jgi:hypothetical protein
MAPFRTLLNLSIAASALLLTACASTPMPASAPAPAAAVPSGIAMMANLSAAKEVPPNASLGTGVLQANFDKSTSMFSWTVTYSGLTGPVRAAHFHGPSTVGINTGVALGITGALDSPIKGSAVLTAAQAADLLAGKWYLNLHTAINLGGEIRGQVDLVK